MTLHSRPAQAALVLSRRAVLLGSAGALACSRRELPAPPLAHETPCGVTGRCGAVELREWSFEAKRKGLACAAVIVPTWGGPHTRYPVLVALHGRGEALKPPTEGALGWPRDYALSRAIGRLCAPPLTEADFEGLVDPVRLTSLNRELRTRPFQGLIVACPYLPDINPRSDAAVQAYGQAVVDILLPRVLRETPALGGAEATGIDGVSLGGAVALHVGLTRSDVFGTVGSLQPAVGGGEAPQWTELVRAARGRNPALRVRLLTSHDDPFRQGIRAISNALRTAGVEHDYVDLPGPHDYTFNRGPGAVEMLAWHDRVLRHA